MITSSIDETLLKLQLSQNDKTNRNSEFLDSVYDIKADKNITKTKELSFNNIKGITLEEIDSLFQNEDERNLAKNLRLATLFTKDENLSLAMFNTVLGQPFNMGLNYLYNSYEDKHLFFNKRNDSLSDLLLDSIKNRKGIQELKSHEVISQDRLDEILLNINSFSFLDALSNSSNDIYDRYKDDDSYSFLYNDFALKYEELKLKYEEQKYKTQSLIKQY